MTIGVVAQYFAWGLAAVSCAVAVFAFLTRKSDQSKREQDEPQNPDPEGSSDFRLDELQQMLSRLTTRFESLGPAYRWDSFRGLARPEPWQDTPFLIVGSERNSGEMLYFAKSAYIVADGVIPLSDLEFSEDKKEFVTSPQNTKTESNS